MTTRTRTEQVTFERPFALSGLDAPLPAGAYSVEIDEELLQGVSFPAYRRVAVLLHLGPTPDHPGRSQTLTIDPSELDAAVARDLAARNGKAGCALP